MACLLCCFCSVVFCLISHTLSFHWMTNSLIHTIHAWSSNCFEFERWKMKDKTLVHFKMKFLIWIPVSDYWAGSRLWEKCLESPERRKWILLNSKTIVSKRSPELHRLCFTILGLHWSQLTKAFIKVVRVCDIRNRATTIL